MFLPLSWGYQSSSCVTASIIYPERRWKSGEYLTGASQTELQAIESQAGGADSPSRKGGR